MASSIQELQARLELNAAAIDTEVSKLRNKLKNELSSVIFDNFFAEIHRVVIRNRDNKGLDIVVEVGFWNAEEGKIDFGSDITIYWDSEEGQFKLNYGTCGSYSIDDIFQVKRAILVAEIWKNATAIRDIFQDVTNASEVYRKLENESYEVQKLIEQTRREERNSQLEEIINKLTVGQILFYDESVRDSFRLFKDYVADWHIASITSKNIKLSAPVLGKSRLLNKTKIASLIRDNKLHVREG